MGIRKGRVGLELPEQHKPAKGAFDIRPRMVEEWVASLPMGNVGETARLVFHALHEVNRLRYPASERFRFMEQLRQPCAYINDALGRRFIGVSFPLPAKTRQVAKLSQALHLEMALGYKAVVEQSLETNFLLRDKQLLMQAIHRATRYLALTLLNNYQLYAPHPSGSWSELHQLYRLAESMDLHTTPIADTHNEELPESSIARGYKQILMLALASPYRLRYGEAEAIIHALGRWAAHTEIIPFDHPDADEALFVVHMDSDREPDYHAFDRQHCDSDACRLVQTQQLSHLLRDELDYLIEHRQRPDHGLSEELLQRLILAWGVPPKRDYQRSQKEGLIEAVIGTSSLHQALAAAYGKAKVSAHRSHFESHLVPMAHARADDMWREIFHQDLPSVSEQQPKAEDSPPPSYSSQRWEVKNESAGGYRLSLSEQPASLVQVGELLGLRTQADDPLSWAVGVVRWIRQMEGQGLELGVQILSPGALPVEMENPEHPGEPQRGLLLPEIKVLGQRASLITPSMHFARGDKLTLHCAGKVSHIVLGKLKQESGLFNQFHFKAGPLDNAPSSDESMNSGPELGASKASDFDSLWNEL